MRDGVSSLRLYTLPIVVAVFGLSITILGYRVFQSDRMGHLEAEFRFDAAHRAGIVEDAFEGLLHAIEPIGRYFEQSDRISRKEYASFVAPSIASSRYSALLWAVPSGGAAWLDTLGRGSLDVFYQVPVLEPTSDLEGILRLPEVADAIAAASLGGRTSVSRMAEFPWNHPRMGVAVCRPVYGASDESGVRRIGFVIGLLSVSSVADSAILDTEPSGLVTTMRDSESRTSAPAYTHALRIGNPLPPDHALGRLKYSRSLSFVDKTWLIEVAPSTVYAKPRDASLAYFLVAGVIASLALSGLLFRLLQGKGKAEAEVVSKSADFESFFSASLDMFAIVDMDGDFKRLNNQWKATLGHATSSMLGSQFIQFVHPDDRTATMEALAALSRDGELSGFVNRYLAHDGAYRSIEWHAILAADRKNIFAAARDISDRIGMEDNLRRSLSEKETLLREVHHRVKNNMQIISSLLNLAAMRSESDNKSFADAAAVAQGRIRSMAMVHERLYRQDSVSAVDMDDYIRELSGHIAEEYGEGAVNLNIEVDSLELDLDTAIPVGLILNELLTNAFKYAGSNRNATVSIKASLQAAVCTLIVEDDGPGLPSEAIERSQAGDTLGLGLVSGLTEQLRGSLLIVPGHGAHFEISFPYPRQ